MMFEMEIKGQLNISDRTLLSGIPLYDSIPKHISCENKTYNVIGISYGISPPYISLEIEKTKDNLIGKKII